MIKIILLLLIKYYFFLKDMKTEDIYIYRGNYRSGMNKTRPPRVVLINAKLGLNIHGLGGWCLLLLSFVLAGRHLEKWRTSRRKHPAASLKPVFYSRSIFKPPQKLPQRTVLNETKSFFFFQITRSPLIPPPFLINHACINYH